MSKAPVPQSNVVATATQQTRAPAKIELKGEIPLGRSMQLIQLPSTASGSGAAAHAEGWMGRRIDYKLATAVRGDHPRISGKGLVTGYGIFGAPGTGKTYFVLQILENLLRLNTDEPSLKYGGIILDPKAALLEEVTSMWQRLGPARRGDLIILKPDLLNDPAALKTYGIDPNDHPSGLNVIDCALTPTELGRMLVLAAQASGVSASEPFWFLAWTNLFAAALTLLEYYFRMVPTVRQLIDAILLPGKRTATAPAVGRGVSQSNRRLRGIEEVAQQLTRDLKQTAAKIHSQVPALAEEQIGSDIRAAAAQIESFFRTDYVHTLEAFISSSFGPFQQYRFQCLSSKEHPRPLISKCGGSACRPSFYDLPIEEGKVILISMGPEDPGMGKMLCTLVKVMFQQSVMSRRERYTSFKLNNFRRPLFLACDEYAEIASEVPGQPVGDGRFFSLARENGCLGLLATQSIHTLENSSLAEAWKSIFSNLGAKFFMGAADNETAEQASELAGTVDWEMKSMSVNQSKEHTFSRQNSIEQRPELPPYVLTHVLQQGDAVAIGSLDGRKTAPEMRFIHVPETVEETRNLAKGVELKMRSVCEKELACPKN